MVNPYSLFGVSSSDSLDHIRSKYRALARQYHPDSPNGDITKFREVQDAWDLIKKHHGTTYVIKKDVWRHKSFFKIYKEE